MSIQISDILSLSRTCYRANISSKKKVLEFISETISHDFPQIKADELFDALVARERLGSTGFGNGVAIPHCRSKHTDSPICALIHLFEPISYDSVDKAPVDILFALIVPEAADSLHLELLKTLAEKLSQPYFREALRNAPTKEALFEAALA